MKSGRESWQLFSRNTTRGGTFSELKLQSTAVQLKLPCGCLVAACGSKDEPT